MQFKKKLSFNNNKKGYQNGILFLFSTEAY